MAATKFTERMAMAEVLALFEALEGTETPVSADLKAFAEARLAKLDEKNEKRKTSEKALAKASADATLTNAMVSVLEKGKKKTSAEVVELLKAKGVEVTPNKVASLLGKAAKAENPVVLMAKDRAKGREVNVWTLA